MPNRILQLLLSCYLLTVGNCEFRLRGYEDALLSSQPGNNDTAEAHVFRESIPQLSSRADIVKLDRAAKDAIHTVVFVVPQNNMTELTRILHDVSDPLSSNYGQHLTREEVANLTANMGSRDAIVSYLNTKNASVISETLSGEYITANAPVGVWEEMFNTEFFTFQQTQQDNITKNYTRAENYWIPRELDDHVESVFNTIEMPVVLYGNLPKLVPARDIKTNKKSTTSNGYVTPALLRSYYNMSNSVTGSAYSTQATFAAIGQYLSPADLKDFQTYFGLPVQPIYKQIGNYTSDSQCVSSNGNCYESNLDIQYIMATSPISPTTYWYTDLQFSDWLVTVANSKNPPLIFSISYGADEIYTSSSEKDAFSTQAIKLGAMGVTIFVSSGDDGANSRNVRSSGVSSCGYSPSYPATNPYVTAVGATSVCLVMKKSVLVTKRDRLSCLQCISLPASIFMFCYLFVFMTTSLYYMSCRVRN